MAGKEATTESVELVVNKLSQAFEYLAAKAGVAADHFWPILVKQQAIEAVGRMFVIAVALVTAGLVFRWAVKVQKEENNKSILDQNEGILIVSAVGFVLACIVSVVAVLNITDSIAMLINPEYYAIKAISVLVK